MVVVSPSEIVWRGSSEDRGENECNAETRVRFANKYAFEKPNDRKALDLMNEAAKAVMTELPELIVAYGVSDEYRCA